MFASRPITSARSNPKASAKSPSRPKLTKRAALSSKREPLRSHRLERQVHVVDLILVPFNWRHPQEEDPGRELKGWPPGGPSADNVESARKGRASGRKVLRAR